MTKMWGMHMPEQVGLNAVDEGFVVIGWAELPSTAHKPNANLVGCIELAKCTICEGLFDL